MNYLSPVGLMCALVVFRIIGIKGYREATGRPVFLFWCKEKRTGRDFLGYMGSPKMSEVRDEQ